VLNPKTGAVLAKLATADGTAANPVNLGPVAAWSENSQNDATVDTLYGGDNLGNVWRFDIGDSDSSKWKVHKLASLVVGTTPQPITSAPELTLIQNQRVIMIGTGRLLADSDMSTKGLQSMYALVDKGQTPPTLITRATLTSKLMTEGSGGVRNVPPTINFDWVNSKGWFIDLPCRRESIRRSTDRLRHGDLHDQHASGSCLHIGKLPVCDQHRDGGSTVGVGICDR